MYWHSSKFTQLIFSLLFFPAISFVPMPIFRKLKSDQYNYIHISIASVYTRAELVEGCDEAIFFFSSNFSTLVCRGCLCLLNSSVSFQSVWWAVIRGDSNGGTKRTRTHTRTHNPCTQTGSRGRGNSLTFIFNPKQTQWKPHLSPCLSIIRAW